MGSQGVLPSALLWATKLFPSMVVPVYTPASVALLILNMNPLPVICVLNTFPNYFFQSLGNTSSSTVVKFIHLFFYREHFLCLVYEIPLYS